VCVYIFLSVVSGIFGLNSFKNEVEYIIIYFKARRIYIYIEKVIPDEGSTHTFQFKGNTLHFSLTSVLKKNYLIPKFKTIMV
jgi:hypothetical protein